MDDMEYQHAVDSPFSAAAAGALIRRKREEMGLSLAELASRTTVGSPQYLHNLEAGRVNVARSKHRASLASVLGLTAQEQAMMLGIQSDASQDAEEQPVDVLKPLNEDEFNLLRLSGETRLACRAGSEVVIVDLGQRELKHKRTYLLDPESLPRQAEASQEVKTTADQPRRSGKARPRKRPKSWLVGVCVADSSGRLSVLVGEQLYSPDEVALLGRVLHRGRNL
jgi:transcriptional regulator with XRE-family HTH domain